MKRPQAKSICATAETLKPNGSEQSKEQADFDSAKGHNTEANGRRSVLQEP